MDLAGLVCARGGALLIGPDASRVKTLALLADAVQAVAERQRLDASSGPWRGSE